MNCKFRDGLEREGILDQFWVFEFRGDLCLFFNIELEKQIDF